MNEFVLRHPAVYNAKTRLSITSSSHKDLKGGKEKMAHSKKCKFRCKENIKCPNSVSTQQV